jgi:hypothetical protein
VQPYGMIAANDTDRIATVEAFLSDPVQHGIPNPYSHGPARRAEFIAATTGGRP